MYNLSLLCSGAFILADRSKCLHYSTENTPDVDHFVCAPAGLLFPRGSVSSSKLIWGLAGQPSQSFHAPAQLQHPNLGLQRQLLHVLAAPQRTEALDFTGGPVVCGGVPEFRTNL